MNQPIVIASRGSALALAQANAVLASCRKWFPKVDFELKIIKTTGDKLQTASLARPDAALPKGLFTKELEVALLEQQADLAVHSLKDLPTDLPDGLCLGAVTRRADTRDVLIYRDRELVREQAAKTEVIEWRPGQRDRRGFRPKLALREFPDDTIFATSSTRRQAQLRLIHPQATMVEVRGNVPTRLQKLAERDDFDALLLAAAGLGRLKYQIRPSGHLVGDDFPRGLCATVLEPETMLPCVGQAAIGIEVRRGDERVAEVCHRLNHPNTERCVTAEREFLRCMGGGCQSPIAGLAEVLGHQIRLRAFVFKDGQAKRAEGKRVLQEPEALGQEVAAKLLA